MDHTRIVLKLGKTAKQSFDLAFDPNKYSAEKKFKKRPKKNKLIFLILLSWNTRHKNGFLLVNNAIGVLKQVEDWIHIKTTAFKWLLLLVKDAIGVLTQEED